MADDPSYNLQWIVSTRCMDINGASVNLRARTVDVDDSYGEAFVTTRSRHGHLIVDLTDFLKDIDKLRINECTLSGRLGHFFQKTMVFA